MNVIAICSLLGESKHANSLTRRFREEPVLRHTIRRLRRVRSLASIVVTHWDDQSADCVFADGVQLHNVGARRPLLSLDTITAAQRWSDGWRGGLCATASCDRGFDTNTVLACLDAHAADAAVLIDPAAALVDPDGVARLIESAAGDRTFYFNHAPPGLGGVLLKRACVTQLIAAKTHAGRMLHYLPDAPTLDPVLSDACVSLPLSVSRATGDYLLNADRRIQHFQSATASMNGTLASSAADTIVRQSESFGRCSALPRDLTIELTARRHSVPIYSPLAAGAIARDDLSIEQAAALGRETAACDDLRVTFAGVGDPLCHPDFPRILNQFDGAHALHVETDLITLSDDTLRALIESNVDVISVHLPAMRPQTYAAVMGIDAMPRVLSNIERLLRARQAARRATPLIVPTLTKTAANYDEVEQWYDTWLRAFGSATIVGPTIFCGRIVDVGVADMTPPLRQPCRRIESRLMLLSNGRFVACEQDASGTVAFGTAGVESIADAWRAAESLRNAHRTANLPAACRNCKEWHRP